MEIDIDNRAERSLDSSRWEEVLATYMRVMALPEDSGVSVSFVADAEMQALNKQYRAIDAPTDVLSFSHEEGEPLPVAEGMPRYLGDIILSVDTITRQAASQNHSWDRETAVLLAHGLLHLLGYDHAEDDEARVMFAKQDSLAALADSIA